MAAGALMRALRSQFEDVCFVITTVTETGQSVARRLAREGDVVTYVPFTIDGDPGFVFELLLVRKCLFDLFDAPFLDNRGYHCVIVVQHFPSFET